MHEGFKGLELRAAFAVHVVGGQLHSEVGCDGSQYVRLNKDAPAFESAGRFERIDLLPAYETDVQLALDAAAHLLPVVGHLYPSCAHGEDGRETGEVRHWVAVIEDNERRGVLGDSPAEAFCRAAVTVAMRRKAIAEAKRKGKHD